MKRPRIRAPAVALALLVFAALLSAIAGLHHVLVTARTCDAGDYAIVASRPYHLGFLDGSYVCDLTLEKRGIWARSKTTQIVGSGTCAMGCDQLVRSAQAQMLIDDTWYSRDGGRAFVKIRERVPPELVDHDNCMDFEVSGDELVVRTWRTCGDGMGKPPGHTLVSRNGGDSWTVLPTSSPGLPR